MGKLILFPNSLAEDISADTFSAEMVKKIASIDGLIVESEKRARKFLKCFSFTEDRTFRDIPLVTLNEHTQDLSELTGPLKKGETWGLISDGGLPCLADPGANLVARLLAEDVKIEAMPGPSSFLHTLMLSGFPAQSFAFHGYFPKDKNNRKEFIQTILRRSEKENAPQLFIEAPYRSHHRFEELLEILSENVYLCIGADIMMQTEFVKTARISDWRKNAKPNLKKRPTVFILYTPPQSRKKAYLRG